MKRILRISQGALFALAVLSAAAGFTACGHGLMETKYNLVLPGLPSAWEKILEKPHWRLEWVDENGKWSSWEGKERFPGLSPIIEWTSPVIAWPFWPEKGLAPGIAYPAGALFPWDLSGASLVLDWNAGVDALFWRELAQCEKAQNGSSTPRFPWYFDWPRFRELMRSEDIPSEIRENPWLAEWSSIAQKTVESGFDRRRIKAEARTEIAIPCPDGLWAAPNPFSEPIAIMLGESLILMVKDTPETWVSASGLLRCQKEAWIFIPWL